MAVGRSAEFGEVERPFEFNDVINPSQAVCTKEVTEGTADTWMTLRNANGDVHGFSKCLAQKLPVIILRSLHLRNVTNREYSHHLDLPHFNTLTDTAIIEAQAAIALFNALLYHCKWT